MKLHVLFEQRVCRFEGEYGVEALACLTEYDLEDNPDYLKKKYERYWGSKQFEALAVIDLEVSEADILKILRPPDAVEATVLGPNSG